MRFGALEMMPAPKGKGLCVEKNAQKYFTCTWGKRYLEQTQRADRNQAESDFRADGRIEKLSEVKVRPEHRGKLAIMEAKAQRKIIRWGHGIKWQKQSLQITGKEMEKLAVILVRGVVKVTKPVKDTPDHA